MAYLNAGIMKIEVNKLMSSTLLSSHGSNLEIVRKKYANLNKRRNLLQIMQSANPIPLGQPQPQHQLTLLRPPGDSSASAVAASTMAEVS